MGSTFDVIMAAYPPAGPAERDFDAPVQLVKDKAVRSEGVILVEKALQEHAQMQAVGRGAVG